MTDTTAPPTAKAIITAATQAALHRAERTPGTHELRLSDLPAGQSSTAYAAAIIDQEIRRSCRAHLRETSHTRVLEPTTWLLRKTTTLTDDGHIHDVTWQLRTGAWQ